ncbi:MAG TPA: SAM-dependent methyltransferase [Acidimicrobiales bacterium]|nr:SAM-dependent methyltransferase [Acidimicrobiales bacterium]MDP6213604.1 SAM-dependent methyltransferase [Acidimicrobiales bacterium]MDP7209071.1 SAM-dependent methyltransferase [Acidimicrobiales bacterium]HJL90582.1 SAM-dependent methyltransferase [Acidimicrobiales bacterium]HJO99716.1 SAM-dependent methyltransferase [Acidimicrobiales bacterium]
MEACLYDPVDGFYTTGGAAGRRGDFITSPEVGPLFGAVLARWMDSVWEGLGSPRGFTVVEAGAGSGTLARSVLAAAPECLTHGRYLAVERSERLRSDHPDGVEPLSDLPAGPLTGVVLANELLDNLAFSLLHGVDDTWHQVRVSADQGCLIEVIAEPGDPPVPLEPVDGARIAVQTEASQWVSRTLSMLEAGSLLVFDYCTTTTEMASQPPAEWLRTYDRHERGGSPLDTPGGQDITVEVATDQLPTGISAMSQADFLTHHGIRDLVDTGRLAWSERAGIGDLEAIRARSRTIEAAALVDLDGIGGFTALEWVAGP